MVAARYDAVVVGSGPNGLTAALTLAQAGKSVLVLEAADRIGGGTKSAELTLPGFRHDICSAVHPLAVASPYLRSLPLDEHGLRFLYPEIEIAHPLDDRPAAVTHRSVATTAAQFGSRSGRYRRLLEPLLDEWDAVLDAVLHPVLRVPRHPVTLGRFGLRALPSAAMIGRLLDDDRAAALFAGCAAHSFLPLTHPLTGSFGSLLLLAAHARGWPVAEGGSQSIADALASMYAGCGGEVRTGIRVRSMRDLPPHRVALFDTDPVQLADIAGDALPQRYARRLRRFRSGPAAWKVDYALDGPVPWTDPACAVAGTVHIGGALADIASAEADVHDGRMPDRPFVLAAQQSIIDPSRAPPGRHTLWAYAHVPNGFSGDATDAVERQIERFAPGFRDMILARHVMSPRWIEDHNPNNRGGDISAGSHGGTQMFLRPTRALHAYRTPNPSIWLCSASTPPGAGVHGMCGHNAATAVLSRRLA
ncbi:MAG: NAD(P)/FAD-dependent oxidoreductase [Ilumatobacteraceae bacterium]